MKTKINKIPFIILITITVILAVAGVLFKTTFTFGNPIKVTSRITCTQTYDNSGNYKIGGKIKNISDKDITIDSYTFRITYKTDKSSEAMYLEVDQPITISPNQEFDLSTFGTVRLNDWLNTNMTKMTMSVDGISYDLTANNTASIVLFVFAGLFGLCAILVLVSQTKTAKAKNNLSAFASENVPNSILVSGALFNKKDAKKNIGKSIASAMGGALSAAFLGFGVYKIYGTGVNCNFIIDSDKIYAFNQQTNKFNLNEAVVITGNDFANAEISTKKKDVIVTNKDKSTTLIFKPAKANINIDELVLRLKEIFTNKTQPSPTEGEINK